MAITYVGSGAEAAATAGANPAVPYPTGIQAGDLLWLPCSASVTTIFATNAVSGFTRRYGLNSAGGSPVGAGFYRIATGAETGTVTLNSPGGLSIGRMFAYRGVDPATPFDVDDAPFGSSTGVTAYVIPEQVTTMPGCTLLLHTWSNASSGTWTQPTFYTELMDSTATATVNATSVAHRLNWAGSGATGTRTVTRSAAVRGGAAGVVLRPALDAVTGASAAVLPVLASTSTAGVTAQGESTGTLPSLAASAAGSLTSTGSSAVTLPSLSAAATGTSALQAASTATMPRMASSAAGVLRSTAQVVVGLPALGSTATGTATATGSSTAVLPTFDSSASASVLLQGSSSAGLPQLSSVITVAAPRVEGESTATLPALAGSAEGLVFLDTSNWRDITVTVGTPYGHPFAVGVPAGHPLQTGAPRSEP